ncbi:fluoride efflux transporter FluC [Paeniglutamicibacter kerguelensis]|uniref:Fluoride-specific ion channel FluC n=1 Tax=Paeniglutamicibacter kerguelensis TaxID=254788 RepID=A0ABS4XBS4_9MICC|nr:CrcB family protein [Paeniglutamicibacter kerguelensis]MBP2385911.1 CrcB protein [Paeniglutamicibacter kerguelensis]
MDGVNRPNHLKWRMWAVVAVGGAFGAASRETFSLLVPEVGGVPVAIAIVNILGAFLLGFLYEALTRPGISGDRASRLKLLLGTGFCGGFTTYSSLAVDTAVLGIHGRPGTALLYVMGTVVLGACATWAGIIAGSRSAKAAREAQ